MIQTFIFISVIQRDYEFRKRLEDAMHGSETTELFCYNTKLTICPKEKMIYIDKTNEGEIKVSPAKMSFNVMNHILADNWDFSPEEITIIRD